MTRRFLISWLFAVMVCAASSCSPVRLSGWSRGPLPSDIPNDGPGGGLADVAYQLEWFCGVVFVLAVAVTVLVPSLRRFTGRVCVAALLALSSALLLAWLAQHIALIIGVSVALFALVLLVVAWRRGIPQDLFDDGKMNGSSRAQD